MDKLNDSLAIRELADQYSNAANSLDAHGMAAVYVLEGELHAFGNVIRGRDAIEQSFLPVMQRFEFVNQVCSGAIIEIDGDRATSRWTVTEFNRRHGAAQLEMFLGTYDDRLVRLQGQWMYTYRSLIVRKQGRIGAIFRE